MPSVVFTSIRDRLARTDIATIALTVLLVVTSLMRFTIGADKPLWLDEVWTGVIVTQPSLGDIIRHCFRDVNAPLYSLLAAVWARASGTSDHALRALPLILGSLAPLVALTPRRNIDRAARFTWCALLACWVPGIWYSQEARPYTLAFVLAVANSVAFVSVLRSPTLKKAWAWMIASTLLILAHYYGFVLVGFQGVAYLMVHKRRAALTWPAALALTPALVSIAFQAHQIQAFANPQSSWIAAPNVLADAAFIIGDNLVELGLVSLWLMAAILIWLRSGSSENRDTGDGRAILWCVPACSLAAVAASIGLGFLRPMFIARYLLEFVPGVFLGLAMIATDLARRWRTAAPTLIALFAAFTCLWARFAPHRLENAFNWEVASNELMAANPSRLVFVWDNPMRPDRNTLAGLGGFFFARARRPIPVDGVQIENGDDPNPLLIAHAAQPGSAILWVYDTMVRGTSAIRFPPDIQELDPRWGCRNFGVQNLGVLACTREWAPPAKSNKRSIGFVSPNFTPR